MDSEGEGGGRGRRGKGKEGEGEGGGGHTVAVGGISSSACNAVEYAQTVVGARSATCRQQQLHRLRIVYRRRNVQRSAAVGGCCIRVCCGRQQQLQQLQMPAIAGNVQPAVRVT